MTVFVLAMHGENGLEVDVFNSREKAEDAFMRDLYECYQDDPDIPDEYDWDVIDNFIDKRGGNLQWSITEEDVQ